MKNSDGVEDEGADTYVRYILQSKNLKKIKNKKNKKGRVFYFLFFSVSWEQNVTRTTGPSGRSEGRSKEQQAAQHSPERTLEVLLTHSRTAPSPF